MPIVVTNLPFTSDERWGGPDVDIKREDIIDDLLPGSDTQTFVIIVPFYTVPRSRAFAIMMHFLEQT